jgi:hypothetical protein
MLPIKEIHYCVDKLPKTEYPYNVSKPLLVYTIYGSYVIAQFRYNFNEIGYFYYGTEARPLSVAEVSFWGELTSGHELYEGEGSELYGERV